MNLIRSLKAVIPAITFVLAGLAMTGCATPPLIDAAGDGNIKKVEVLLDQGADVNMKGGGGGNTALDMASLYGHADVVRLLLDRGAKMDRGGEWSTLSYASMWLHTDIMYMLLDRGADINRAIAEMDRAIGQGSSVELLKAIKQDRAASLPRVAKYSTEIYTPSFIVKSDVDELPAIKTKPNKNSYAIVIGIEKYRQKLPNADHAVNDAKIMTEYLTKVMGYPEGNVVTLTNEHASLTDFIKYFEKWLLNNVDQESTVFIYYSGHGAPNLKTGDAYLVPYDGDPSFIEQTGYPLKKLYETLRKLPAKEIIVALDSCFSGAGGKSVIAQGARPLVMNLEQNFQISKNMIVMTASSGDQISSSYEEKGHGLFTYFLLKGIKGGITEVGELYDYLKPNVKSTARKTFNNEQTPQLIAPDNQKVFLRN